MRQNAKQHADEEGIGRGRFWNEMISVNVLLPFDLQVHFVFLRQVDVVK